MKYLFDVFNEVNSDGSGSIDIVEFKRHIYKSKPHLSPMAVSIFHTLDKVGVMAPTLSTLTP